MLFGPTGGDYSFGITRLVADWVSGSRPNNGVLLKAATENGAQVNGIYGANAGGGRPELVVRWLPRLGLSGSQEFYDVDLTDRLGVHVNLANGNLAVQASDLQVTAPGLPVQVTRVYNSRGANLGGPLGDGWNDDLGRVRATQEGDGSITYVSAGRVTHRFWPAASGGGVFTSPTGLQADATIGTGSSAGQMAITFRSSGTVLRFRAADGLLVSATDRNGLSQTFTYSTTVLSADGLPYLSSVTDAAGRVFTVNRGYYVSKVADPTGRGTSYGYSGNLLTSATDPTGAVTTYGYDSSGRLEKITTPTGRITIVCYDSLNRVTALTRVSDTASMTGPTTTFTYTDPNTPGGTGTTVLTDANNNPTTYTWDVRDRVTKVKDALNRTRSKGFGPDDNVLTTVDANSPGSTSTFGYDADFRPTGSTSPTGGVGALGYGEAAGPVGNRVAHWQPSSSTSSDGNKNAFTYDGVGNLLKTQDTTAGPTGGVSTQASYNPPVPAAPGCGGLAGQVCAVTDGRGIGTSYSYDAAGNLTGTDHPAPLGTPAPPTTAWAVRSPSPTAKARPRPGCWTQPTGYCRSGCPVRAAPAAAPTSVPVRVWSTATTLTATAPAWPTRAARPPSPSMRSGARAAGACLAAGRARSVMTRSETPPASPTRSRAPSPTATTPPTSCSVCVNRVGRAPPAPKSAAPPSATTPTGPVPAPPTRPAAHRRCRP